MREESHLDDMRSAIRGDFERLAERRGGQELMREPEPELEPKLEPGPELETEPAPDPEQELEVKPEPVPDPDPGSDSEPVDPVGEPPGESPHRSFFDRLLGR